MVLFAPQHKRYWVFDLNLNERFGPVPTKKEASKLRTKIRKPYSGVDRGVAKQSLIDIIEESNTDFASIKNFPVKQLVASA